MIADRIVLGFLIIGFLILLVGFISTVLRWMSVDARTRGRSKWIPATLFLGLPLMGGSIAVFLRARIPVVAGITLVLLFIGIIGWLIMRPRRLHSVNEKPDHAANALKCRLGWLCAGVAIFAAATPFCISFLVLLR
jgi:hypothetical protein